MLGEYIDITATPATISLHTTRARAIEQTRTRKRQFVEEEAHDNVCNQKKNTYIFVAQ